MAVVVLWLFDLKHEDWMCAKAEKCCWSVDWHYWLTFNPRPSSVLKETERKKRGRERTGGGRGRGGVGNKQVCQAYHLLLGKSCVSACSALNRVWTWPDVIPSALSSKSNGPCLRWNQRAIFSPARSLYISSLPSFKSQGLKCTAKPAALRKFYLRPTSHTTVIQRERRRTGAASRDFEKWVLKGLARDDSRCVAQVWTWAPFGWDLIPREGAGV